MVGDRWHLGEKEIYSLEKNMFLRNVATFLLVGLSKFSLRHCYVEFHDGEKSIKGETIGHCLFLVQKWPHL